MKQTLANILTVYGIPDNNQITVTTNEGLAGKLHPKFKGTNVITQLVDQKDFNMQNLILGGEKEHIQLQLQQPDLIYNAISGADIHQKSLNSFEEKFDSLKLPILNHPKGIYKTTRDKVYEQFKDEKEFTAPKTLRVTPKSVKDVFALAATHAIEFPFIFRTVGDNNGNDTYLITSQKDSELLERFPFDGREFYLIAYHNYLSPDKLFRKYRVVVIDGAPIKRHLLVSKYWKIDFDGHNEVLKTQKKEIQTEEENYIKSPLNPKVQKMVEKLYNHFELQYFGCDYYEDENGEVLLFEANSSMKPYLLLDYGPQYFQDNAKHIQTKLKEMFMRYKKQTIKGEKR